MLENSSPWAIMNHNELKKNNPQWIRDPNVAATRKCNANLRISCVAWPTSHAAPMDWDGWSPSWSEMCPPKIVKKTPCAWNRNPWKSQTMSIWFGLTCFFFEKKSTKSAAFICRVCWHTQAMIKKLPHFTPGRKNPQSKSQTHTTWIHMVWVSNLEFAGYQSKYIWILSTWIEESPSYTKKTTKKLWFVPWPSQIQAAKIQKLTCTIPGDSKWPFWDGENVTF